MASGFEISLLSSDEATRAAVHSALNRPPLDVEPAVAATPERLAAMLARGTVPLALIDVDPDPANALAQVGRLARMHPDTRFVLLCRTLDTRFALQAMQAGARDCIEKSRLANELLPAVQRYLEEFLGRDRRNGKLVTVLSASGGTGATSLAINLAVEAADLLHQPALLIDLDLAYGSIATLLGVESRYGVADVLSQNGVVDPELVRSTASVHSDRLHALVSPVSVDFSSPAPLALSNLEGALGAIRRAYEFSVVDAPRVPMDVAATLAKASDLTLMVFQQDVVDIRTMISMIAALEVRGTPRERLLAVANRFHKRRSMLDLPDIRQALGTIDVFTVRNDYEGALRGINYGQPLAKVAARSVIRKDLGELLRRAELSGLSPARQS